MDSSVCIGMSIYFLSNATVILCKKPTKRHTISKKKRGKKNVYYNRSRVEEEKLLNPVLNKQAGGD